MRLRIIEFRITNTTDLPDIAELEQRENFTVIQIILKDWGEYIIAYLVTKGW